MRPRRESTRQSNQTYFVGFQTAGRKPFFRHERWANLFLNILHQYRSSYLLHAYVIMPDHVHLLLTPVESLERSIQLLKGGFSYRAKRELDWSGDVWQAGFSDHRIRDLQDFYSHIVYIEQNPVRARLCERAEDYLYSSLSKTIALDAVPQRLKPQAVDSFDGGAEAPPLQKQVHPSMRASAK
jgi:putative transposase